MDLNRNNVTVRGSGPPIMFAHGFGCDQNMWRFVEPAFSDNTTILFDSIGAGKSDLTAYSQERYSSLQGYADDVVGIISGLGLRDVVFVGHSVAAMVGVLAAKSGLIKALVLVAPSPCYINEDGYTGGFTRPQIDELLQTLDENHLGWSNSMAPVIMGHPGKLDEELTNSFCRTDPEIAKDFARVTFLSDYRNELPACAIPTLILQCSKDVIAPDVVGRYMNEKMPNSSLVQMKATGHCPNLSSPQETVAAIKAFL